MSAFNSYGTLMGTADIETGIAEFVLPPAMWIRMQFSLSKGNPVNLEKAAKAWDQAAKDIEQTRTLLQQKVSAVSAKDWSADDRPAYEKKVQEFIDQLGILHTFVQAVSIALIAFAWALMVYAIFAVAMGTFLAALAATAAAAAAGIITAEIYAACLEIAATCVPITMAATGVLAAAGTIAAAVFQGGSLLAAVSEAAKGNDQAMSDFATAQATGSAAALANLGQNAVNGALTVAGTRNKAMGKEGGSPIVSVDLDADRNADHTWNIGGGETVSAGGFQISGGQHVKWGDHGFAGGDISGGVRAPHGVASVNGSAEYTDEDGIGQGKSGSLKYSAEGAVSTPQDVDVKDRNNIDRGMPLPNAGLKGGISGEHNFETGHGKVTSTGSVTANGGDAVKGTGTMNYDGQGHTSTSTSEDTPIGTYKQGDETPPWDK